ncbi:hypothetical protein NIES4103_38260 [Nostoc sp. NIES-4103]|nr:hypothetical protein NIES4103_38260 [Nostoc sp. NIES-4103]
MDQFSVVATEQEVTHKDKSQRRRTVTCGNILPYPTGIPPVEYGGWKKNQQDLRNWHTYFLRWQSIVKSQGEPVACEGSLCPCKLVFKNQGFLDY